MADPSAIQVLPLQAGSRLHFSWGAADLNLVEVQGPPTGHEQQHQGGSSTPLVGYLVR